MNINKFIKPIFKSNKRCIVANCSNEYIFCLDTCLKSIKKHISMNSTYDFVIIEDNITTKNKNKIIKKYSSTNFSIRFENLDDLFDINTLYLAQYDYSLHSYYKLIIPDIFSSYEKVLYTDLDMIFQCDINKILDLDMGVYPIAMTRDFPIAYFLDVFDDTTLRNYLKDNLNITDSFDYFSAGIVLFNIRYIAKKSSTDCINLAFSKKFKMQEQDILNFYYNKNIYEIPYKYCINTPWIDKFTDEFLNDDAFINQIIDAKKELCVLHYSSREKPWKKWNIDSYDKIWFKYNKNLKYRSYILANFINFFYKKEKFRNQRKITILNCIRVSYKKHKKYTSTKKFLIKNLGKNNKFNGQNSSYIDVQGSGILIVKGNNNKIKISQSSILSNSHIEIWGDNVEFLIGDNSVLNNLYAIISGSNEKQTKCKVIIGDNFINTEDLQIFGGGNKNMDIEIGNDCMFARRIAIYAHDGHNIYDATTGELINIPNNSLKIGNHVWVGHGVNILKGTIIPNNTIIGAGSVVTGIFKDENTAIAGNPAKIVRKNLRWEK